VPITLRPSLPVPKPLDVRVRRDGDDLVVTWHTASPARRTTFAVYASDRGDEVPLAFGRARGRGRRSFSVRLRDAARARRVMVVASGESDRRPRHVTVSGDWRA
jgi:hypothetical protein